MKIVKNKYFFKTFFWGICVIASFIIICLNYVDIKLLLEGKISYGILNYWYKYIIIIIVFIFSLIQLVKGLKLIEKSK